MSSDTFPSKCDTFKFAGTKIPGKVIRVHDADTFTLILKVFDSIKSNMIAQDMKYAKFNIRFSNIDSPELNSDNILEADTSKMLRDYVKALVQDKIVYVDVDGQDKYGRLLGNIYLNPNDDESLNTKLVKGGLVRVYTKDDLHKDPWTEEELINIQKNIKVIDMDT